MDKDLENLRRILLGDEYEELLKFRIRLNDDELFAQHVARIISEALQSRAESDDSLAIALAPTIDQAIAGSIERDPHRLAHALYPIMGPAIRKSIAQTLQQMLEGFNRALESTLSIQALRWRYQAWRTGKSYSEVVLLNTLDFRVEQVFLIHSETGLLLRHRTALNAPNRDPEIVSGMFSAIRDWIKDSFHDTETGELHTLTLGDLHVLVQSGPQALVAVVIRGRVAHELRADMDLLLEKIHGEHGDTMREWRGETEPFAVYDDDLGDLLQVSFQELPKAKSSGKPWPAIIAGALVFVVLLSVMTTSYFSNMRRDAVLQALRDEPGIVVLPAGEGMGYDLNLLVDPLARPLNEIVDIDSMDEFFQYRTYSFISSEDAIVTLRAKNLLEPDSEVDLQVKDGILHLDGHATAEWVESFLSKWPSINGITGVDSSNLQLYSSQKEKVDALKSAIEKTVFRFNQGQVRISNNAPGLETLAYQILQLNRLSHRQFQRPVTIDIVGYTDESGSSRVNERVGLERAESLRQLLLTRGVEDADLRTFSGQTYGGGRVRERKTQLFVQYQ